MANSAQSRAAAKAVAYRQQMLAEITAGLPTCTSLVLVIILAAIRKFRREQPFETEQDLCLAAARHARKGLPRPLRLPFEESKNV